MIADVKNVAAGYFEVDALLCVREPMWELALV